MNQSPQCNYFDPKDPAVRESCSNCTKWIGPQCLDHLMLLKRCETKKMFEMYNQRENPLNTTGSLFFSIDNSDHMIPYFVGNARRHLAVGLIRQIINVATFCY